MIRGGGSRLFHGKRRSVTGSVHVASGDTRRCVPYKCRPCTHTAGSAGSHIGDSFATRDTRNADSLAGCKPRNNDSAGSWHKTPVITIGPAVIRRRAVIGVAVTSAVVGIPIPPAVGRIAVTAGVIGVTVTSTVVGIPIPPAVGRIAVTPAVIRRAGRCRQGANRQQAERRARERRARVPTAISAIIAILNRLGPYLRGRDLLRICYAHGSGGSGGCKREQDRNGDRGNTSRIHAMLSFPVTRS